MSGLRVTRYPNDSVDPGNSGLQLGSDYDIPNLVLLSPNSCPSVVTIKFRASIWREKRSTAAMTAPNHHDHEWSSLSRRKKGEVNDYCLVVRPRRFLAKLHANGDRTPFSERCRGIRYQIGSSSLAGLTRKRRRCRLKPCLLSHY